MITAQCLQNGCSHTPTALDEEPGADRQTTLWDCVNTYTHTNTHSMRDSPKKENHLNRMKYTQTKIQTHTRAQMLANRCRWTGEEWKGWEGRRTNGKKRSLCDRQVNEKRSGEEVDRSVEFRLAALAEQINGKGRIGGVSQRVESRSRRKN